MLKKVICLCLLLIAANASCYEISATSSLSPQNDINYGPHNLADNDRRSAWCAKTSSKNLVLKLTADSSAGSKIGILNGYGKSKQKYYENARVKDVTIVTNKLSKDVTLDDSSDLQIIDVDKFKELTFSIKSVYPGSKYKDVCISEIVIDKMILDASGKLLQAIKTDRARTANEIKYDIGPIYKKYNKYLERSIGYLLDNKTEQLFRLLIDFNYYQQKYESTMYAELAEGIDDWIQSFFNKHSDVVEKVLKDPNQLNKIAIADNFGSYLQREYPLDFDSKNLDNKLPPHLKRLKKLFIRAGGRTKITN